MCTTNVGCADACCCHCCCYCCCSSGIVALIDIVNATGSVVTPVAIVDPAVGRRPWHAPPWFSAAGLSGPLVEPSKALCPPRCSLPVCPSPVAVSSGGILDNDRLLGVSQDLKILFSRSCCAGKRHWGRSPLFCYMYIYIHIHVHVDIFTQKYIIQHIFPPRECTTLHKGRTCVWQLLLLLRTPT